MKNEASRMASGIRVNLISREDLKSITGNL